MDKPWLSLIIPYHLAYGADFERALSSVYTQIGVDLKQVEVITVNDGGPALPQTLAKRWPLQQVTLARSMGAGVARQAGIDHAHGDYVMFLDADDMLASPMVLHAFLAACADRPDVILAPFWGETRTGDGVAYDLRSALDVASVDAKAYRRGYLDELGLTFHPKLRVYEDVYFVSLALAFTQKTVTLTTPAFVWRLNWQSTGRRNGFAMVADGAMWVRSGRYQLQFLKAHHAKRWAHDFYELLANIYSHMQQYPPQDPQAVAAEVQQLLQENQHWWHLPRVKPLIRELARQKAQAQHLDLAGIDAYLNYLEELA
ncbi:glycosyltransferase family 2 protein [Lacticaseibacillus baoqingensis]|uniref:Glycosyltransferase family 2 protein n=1 Tax=Lacticaseibacillus baoqingensis TaxID=2486013 RepID=A0ABW4E5R0_9LACO|nr:glycosyltransferase family A protein [Lacticaseibacillus baoqingensis]